MTIDKVRAALEHAKSCARNEYSMHVYKEALSELDGMVILPIEMTEAMNEAIRSRFGCYDCTATEVDADNAWSDLIAPYVKGK